MRDFAILLLFNLLGAIGHSVAHIPVPGAVLGLILFTLCLFLRLVKLEWVEQPASVLLKLRDSEFQDGASGLAMALAGVITSLMIIPLQWWLR